MIKGTTKNLGVMGWPIAHSLSPVLQNAAIEEAGLDYVYISLPVFEKADKFIMCCGQGAWEGDLLASTRELQAILESKGIHPIVDIWGEDVSHDWYWWEKQWVYFLQMTLDDKK